MQNTHTTANKLKHSYRLAVASLIALIMLCLVWEGWLAPLHAGSHLYLKALPLLLPLFGIIRGKRYTYQWASMFILLYMAEGATRLFTDTGISAWLAFLELLLSVIFFISAAAYARFSAPSRINALSGSTETPR